jgi:hypothetical protein
VGAATHAASLSGGSQKLNNLETLEPMKKAMMQALARRRLLDDEELGRQMLGDEYDAFMKQAEKEVRLRILWINVAPVMRFVLSGSLGTLYHANKVHFWTRDSQEKLPLVR